MEIEEARDAVIEELHERGVDARALTAAIVSAHVARIGRCAEVNIDFERDGNAIKISLLVHADGLNKVGWFAAIGTLSGLIQGASVEPGREGLQRTTEGVLFKLNTGVAWSTATAQDISHVAEIATAFKGAVEAVAE